jgi:hypothetical protein
VREFVSFEVGEVLTLKGKRIEVLSASHSVPAFGFAVECGGAQGATEQAAWARSTASIRRRPGRRCACPMAGDDLRIAAYHLGHASRVSLQGIPILLLFQ